MIAVRVTISGRVQGVGYRDAMVDVASAAGVCGWVRNRRDGTVEALIQGEDAAVETLLAWCRRGPPAARVTEVARTNATIDAGLVAFERRSTAWT